MNFGSEIGDQSSVVELCDRREQVFGTVCGEHVIMEHINNIALLTRFLKPL